MIKRKCFKCGIVPPHWETEIVTYSNGTEHLKGTCPICGSTTTLPKKKEFKDYVFFFGKHKGKNITEVPEDYLIWTIESDTASGGMALGILNYLEAKGININNYRK